MIHTFRVRFCISVEARRFSCHLNARHSAVQSFVVSATLSQRARHRVVLKGSEVTAAGSLPPDSAACKEVAACGVMIGCRSSGRVAGGVLARGWENKHMAGLAGS